MIFKLYLIEAIVTFYFISLIFGIAMLLFSFAYFLNKIEYAEESNELDFVLNEISKHKIYVFFMIVFLIIIPLFGPSRRILQIMLGI